VYSDVVKSGVAIGNPELEDSRYHESTPTS